MALVPSSSRATSSSSGSSTLLSTTTLGADGTIDVTGIDQSYNDLRMVAIVRGTTASIIDNLIMRFNNDSGTNYDYGFFFNSNATISQNSGTATASPIVTTKMTAASDAAGRFTFVDILIPGYASATYFKAALCHYVSQLSVGVTTDFNGSSAIFWNSQVAITRVTLFGQTAANLLTGSQLRIYGVL